MEEMLTSAIDIYAVGITIAEMFLGEMQLRYNGSSLQHYLNKLEHRNRNNVNYLLIVYYSNHDNN